MTGICASSGIEKEANSDTVPALLRPSPSTRLMPAPRKVSARPADHLVGLQGDGDKGVDLAEQTRRDHGYQHAQPGIPGGNRHAVGAHRAHQHHPFDAQVHHTGTLGK